MRDEEMNGREFTKMLASPAMFQTILSAVMLARRGKFGARDTAAEIQNKIVTATIRIPRPETTP